MPKGHTHMLAGAAAGLVVAFLDRRVLDPEDRFWFVAGAAAGGALGGRLPDKLDPPHTPNHRQFFHGVIPAGVTGKLLFDAYKNGVGWVLAKAHAAAVVTRPDGTTTATFTRIALFFAAGVVEGLPPGYASHLLLDFCTPKCLPWIGSLDQPAVPVRRCRRRGSANRTMPNIVTRKPAWRSTSEGLADFIA